ncbi:MAG TPA: arylesterase [Lamprocystis sp. (in: g-proteobacteria)]|nr:arylesterase [Lamprocystis sp. (in: g-proteobacteria)]
MMRLLYLAVLAVAVAGAARAAAPTNTPTILVLGDSLSAAYGIDQDVGWVNLLQGRLRERGLTHQVINAGISGDTTAGGLTRLPDLLARHRPAILVVELGANDGLRGLKLDVIRANLTRIVQLGQEAGSQVLLIGIRLPPNYGAAYERAFQAVFQTVAAAQGVPLVPFLLDGVAQDRALMQADGVHPATAAQPRILENVWPALESLLGAVHPALS